VIRWIALFLIRCYKKLISPLLGTNVCRFYPRCSDYSRQAFETHNPFMALWLTCKRLIKCHPWHPGGLDPLKPNETKEKK
tara:strand:+ start:16488 stop:16727 length:240 start_codon:yes stop_codon:yes gene_type:complete